MKDTILFSESILLEGIPPSDLLDENRFELRSIQSAPEMILIATEKPPAGIVLDLQELQRQNIDLSVFISDLQTAGNAQKGEDSSLIPLLGIISAEAMRNPQEFFQAGVNDLLVRPYGAEDLQDKLQTLLAQKFRRFERKEIQYKFALSQGSQTWNVIGRIINRECLLVEGENLPPMGFNVFLTSTGLDPLSLYLWSHCWRTVKGGMLLRFLNPSKELLQKIDQLPPFPGAPAPVEHKPPPPAETRSEAQKQKDFSLDDLWKFQSFSLEQITREMPPWFQDASALPPLWQELFQQLPPFEKKRFLEKDGGSDEVVKAACVLKLALLAQIHGLRSRDLAQEPLEKHTALLILAAHEKQVKDLSAALQSLIQKGTDGDNSIEVAQLNLLKSDLQKCLIGLHVALHNKGIETPKSPSLRPTTPQKIEPRSVPEKARKTEKDKTTFARHTPAKPSTARSQTKAIVLAVLLILLAGGSIFTYFTMFQNRLYNGVLDPEQTAQLNPLFAEVRQYKGKGQLNFTILLKDTWLQLSPAEQKNQLQKMTEKFQSLQVTSAAIRASNGIPVADFSKGKMYPVVLPSPPPASSASN